MPLIRKGSKGPTRRYYMKSWNTRNGQRATVKRPGTSEYRADYANKNKQFFEKKTQSACKCGSVHVRVVANNGKLSVLCSKCGRTVTVRDVSKCKVGNWSELEKLRTRAGTCRKCGGHHFHGKMHWDATRTKYVLSMRCDNCNAERQWHNL